MAATLLKKRLWYWRVSVNFAKFLRTACFIDELRWLPLISGSGFDRSRVIRFLFVTNK